MAQDDSLDTDIGDVDIDVWYNRFSEAQDKLGEAFTMAMTVIGLLPAKRAGGFLQRTPINPIAATDTIDCCEG